MIPALRWIVYCLLASTAIAVVAFPAPKPEEFLARDRFTQNLHDGRDGWAFHSELFRRAQARQVAHDAVSRAISRSDGNFDMVAARDVPQPFADAVRTSATRAYGNLLMGDTAIRIVIALMVDTSHAYDGTPLQRAARASSSDTFLPGAIDSHSCVIVVRAMSKRALEGRFAGFLDGPCYWYKQYGLPGRGMATLLDSTNNRLIVDHGSIGPSQFGFDISQWSTVQLASCGGGSRRACEGLLLLVPERGPGIASLRTPGWIGDGRSSSYMFFGYPSTEILSLMERELGPESFRRVWQSDLAFPDAFAAVRGVPLGEWIYRLVRTRGLERRNGPIPPGRLWLALAVAVPSLIGLGVYGTARRLNG